MKKIVDIWRDWRERKRKKKNELSRNQELLRVYDFNESEEKKIYDYLRRTKTDVAPKNSPEKKYQFDRYSDWKDYVINKHEERSIVELEEFKKRLEWGKCSYVKFDAIFTVFLSVTLAMIPAFKIEEYALSESSHNVFAMLVAIIVAIIIFILAIIGIVYVVKNFFNFINFLKDVPVLYNDFIEIIDELIMQKKNNLEAPQPKKKSERSNRRVKIFRGLIGKIKRPH